MKDIPKHVAERIREDIKRASACWQNLSSDAAFDIGQASGIAYDLCVFIKGELETAYLKGYGDATRELIDVTESGMPKGCREFKVVEACIEDAMYQDRLSRLVELLAPLYEAYCTNLDITDALHNLMKMYDELLN